jgi:hypothetical protein
VEGDAFAAYSGSCRACRQRWLSAEELVSLSPWSDTTKKRSHKTVFFPSNRKKRLSVTKTGSV